MLLFPGLIMSSKTPTCTTNGSIPPFSSCLNSETGELNAHMLDGEHLICNHIKNCFIYNETTSSSICFCRSNNFLHLQNWMISSSLAWCICMHICWLPNFHLGYHDATINAFQCYWNAVLLSSYVPPLASVCDFVKSSLKVSWELVSPL